jgi:hypothetical protein
MIIQRTTKDVTKVEGVVKSAGVDGSAGRIYVPRSWISIKVIVLLNVGKGKDTPGGE